MSVKARVQMALGACTGLLILAACFGALYWLLMPERFPVSRFELKGELKHTTRTELEAALPRVTGNAAVNFFALDLASVRASVERLPWVRRVEVRRAWPAGLEVSIEEHVALARWGDDRLVNSFGETFSANTREVLPAFIAPGGSAAEVTRRYHRFSQILAPLGTPVERVVLTQRHAWQLRLGNGLHLMLGRDADLAEERLRKFVEFYPKAKPRDYVDLRYPNGFAVRAPDWNG
jgi:cell division protein FtsQ